MTLTRENCPKPCPAVEVDKTYEWAFRSERETVTVVKVFYLDKPEVVCKPVLVTGDKSGEFLTDLCLFGAEV